MIQESGDETLIEELAVEKEKEVEVVKVFVPEVVEEPAIDSPQNAKAAQNVFPGVIINEQGEIELPDAPVAEKEEEVKHIPIKIKMEPMNQNGKVVVKFNQPLIIPDLKLIKRIYNRGGGAADSARRVLQKEV